jgi:cold shock CspA family protein
MRGTIKWYNSTAGYGFITLVGLRGDVFVSAHQVAKAGLDGLAAGDEVHFDVEIEDQTGKARAVRLGRIDA